MTKPVKPTAKSQAGCQLSVTFGRSLQAVKTQRDESEGAKETVRFQKRVTFFVQFLVENCVVKLINYEKYENECLFE